MGKVVKLKEIAELFNGKTPSKSEQRDKGFPVLKIKDVNDEGNFIGYFDSFVDEELAKKEYDKILQQGDVLILNAAHNPDYIGTKIYHCEYSTIGSLATGEWMIVRPSKEVLPRYIYHLLTYLQIKKSIRKIVRGIHLYPTDVGALEVFLPNLKKQLEIVCDLDKADHIRCLRKYALKLTDSFLQSVFWNMFVIKKMRIGETKKVKDIAKYMRTGPFGSQLLHSEFTSNGIAVLGIDNAVNNCFAWDERRFISKEKYLNLKRYTVYPDDIIITIMGTCGKTAIVPKDIPLAISTKHLCSITLDKSICLPTYLHAYFLYHPYSLMSLSTEQRGAIMDGLNMGIIEDINVVLPSMELQNQFEKIVLKTENIKSQQKESLRQSEMLFQSLLHKAFNGELRMADEKELVVVK